MSAAAPTRGLLLLVSPEGGGVAAVASGAAAELSRRGWSVRTVSVPRSGAPARAALAAARRERRALREADVVHVELGALDLGAFWFGLLATHRRRDLVLVAHDVPRIVLAPGAGLLRGGTRVRDAVAHRLLAPLLDRALVRRLNRRSAVGVVLSERAVEEWDGDGPARVVSIEHGADPPAPDRVAPSAGEHVLYAGFLGEGKGVDLLLEAWARVGADSPLPLVVAGTATGAGPGARYEAMLRARSATLPRPPRWLGAVPDAEFARLFARAAVVVLPYRRSNPASGIAVRAAVEGRAILASRVPATAGLRDGVDALLVPPGDLDALAAALATLLASPDLRDRLGGAAAAAASERHTWSRHADGLERAYALARSAR